jgi:hypothetical protein
MVYGAYSIAYAVLYREVPDGSNPWEPIPYSVPVVRGV